MVEYLKFPLETLDCPTFKLLIVQFELLTTWLHKNRIQNVHEFLIQSDFSHQKNFITTNEQTDSFRLVKENS